MILPNIAKLRALRRELVALASVQFTECFGGFIPIGPRLGGEGLEQAPPYDLEALVAFGRLPMLCPVERSHE